MDGSSTVFVISEAIAEEYRHENLARVSVSASGTGGGFKKLCDNRVIMIGASRKISEGEKELCKKNNVDYLELPIAYDGIVLAINNKNTWVSSFDKPTLKKIFEPEAEDTILTWQDINPSWPKEKLELFIPGISSGTYDYFTETIVGKAHASRGDVISSEDDNVLVQGVINNKYGLAFFSFAYYLENKDKLKVVPIIDQHTNGSKMVMPSVQSIRSGEYSPLSRLLYLYANKNMDQQDAYPLLRFYLEKLPSIVSEVGFIPLNDEHYQAAHKALLLPK